jgi:hypothetical protein
MYEFGVPAHDRLQIYDLGHDDVRKLIAQVAKDLSFIDIGLEAYGRKLSKAPNVKESYGRNIVEIKAVIAQHFKALFSDRCRCTDYVCSRSACFHGLSRKQEKPHLHECSFDVE